MKDDLKHHLESYGNLSHIKNKQKSKNKPTKFTKLEPNNSKTKIQIKNNNKK